jgi:Superinfection immunity protein
MVIQLLADGDSDGSGGGWILLILLGIGYFLPTIVAAARHVRNAASVFVLNLFLGWTLIGWVIALAMAARTVDRGEPPPPYYGGPGPRFYGRPPDDPSRYYGPPEPPPYYAPPEPYPPAHDQQEQSGYDLPQMPPPPPPSDKWWRPTRTE